MMRAARGGLMSTWLRVLSACAALLAAPAQAAPFAYITNQGSHDVSVVDVALERVVATIKVGRSPAGVAVHSASGRVYVSNPDSKNISVLGMRENALLMNLPAGLGPVGIAVSPNGRWLAAADWFAAQVLVWELTTTTVPEPQRIAVGHAPAGLVFAADNATLYVAERDEDRVSAIDLVSGRVRAQVRVGQHPFALLEDAPRQRLYALNVQSDDVTVIDTRHFQVSASVAVGRGPYGAALALGGRWLYVTNQLADSVSVIDAETLQLRHTLSGFGYPEGVAAHGDKVWVVNWMDDRLSVLDAATGRLLRHVATGSNPRAFGDFIGAPPHGTTNATTNATPHAPPHAAR